MRPKATTGAANPAIPAATMEANMEAVAHATPADQAASTTPLSITLPALAAGEFHGGIHFDESGTPTHWVIGRLPKEPARLDWATHMAQHGDAMPTRREALLLDANARQHIPVGWHWTGEQRAGNVVYAHCQYFGNGVQDFNHKSSQYRVVLVRRVPIQSFTHLACAA